MAEVERIRVRNFAETSEQLTAQHLRLKEAESVTAIAAKAWKWSKVFAPILLGAVVAASGPSSPLGKFAAFLMNNPPPIQINR